MLTTEHVDGELSQTSQRPWEGSSGSARLLKDFAGSTEPKLLYSDNSGEIKEAVKSL